MYLFDGTTVTMPDTPANQAAYPQVYNQGPGLGFPIARVGAVMSLASGAVVNLGFCRYAGKGEGEVSLLRRLWDTLRPGDVLLADRLTVCLNPRPGVPLSRGLRVTRRTIFPSHGFRRAYCPVGTPWALSQSATAEQLGSSPQPPEPLPVDAVAAGSFCQSSYVLAPGGLTYP